MQDFVNQRTQVVLLSLPARSLPQHKPFQESVVCPHFLPLEGPWNHAFSLLVLYASWVLNTCLLNEIKKKNEWINSFSLREGLTHILSYFPISYGWQHFPAFSRLWTAWGQCFLRYRILSEWGSLAVTQTTFLSVAYQVSERRNDLDLCFV